MMRVCKSLQSVRFSREPKGIGSILGEDLQRRGGGSLSLRRTLSADMSSQGWTPDNPLRKTCSSYELSCNSDSHEDERDGGDIFSMSDGEEEKESTLAAELDRDLWSLMSLQNQKSSMSWLIPRGEQNKKVESLSLWEPCKPYVLPMKRSTLSEQSLRMCTEALGCESGTGCSDHSHSDLDDIGSSSSSEDRISLPENEDEEKSDETLEFQSKIDKFGGNVRQKEAIFRANSIRAGRSFPPPLSSVSGAAVHMRSVKQDGRLLLQAVKVDSHKYLRAHRHGGRLQLHFISSPPNCSRAEEETEEEEEELKAPKIPESEPEEHKEEFKSQRSAPKEHKVSPPVPQLMSLMFSSPSNLRRHVMKSEYHNLPISKECFRNFNFNSKEQRQSSLLKEVRCSRRSSNDFDFKFRRHSPPPRSPKLCSSNEFCKAAAPASLNAFKNSLQSRPPSRSLITTPSLLSYPPHGIRSAATDLTKSAHSLPKLPLKEGIRRCKESNWLLNWEPSCIPIS